MVTPLDRVLLTDPLATAAPETWTTLQDIATVNPDVKHFFAPWSQPAWMKQNQKNGETGLHGGILNPEYYDTYVQYLTKTMQALEAINISTFRLSLQNEPLYEPSNYPGTHIPAELEASLGDKVRQAFDANNLTHVGLIAWDHNWDNPSYPVEVFDQSTSFAGSAFHCYSGSPSAQYNFTREYPEAELHFTECTRVTQNFNELWPNLKTQGQQLLTGTIAYGAQSVLLWNAVLERDVDGFTTPTLPNVCTNCLAPVLVSDAETGEYEIPSDFATLAMGSLATRLRMGEEKSFNMGTTAAAGQLLAQGRSQQPSSA